MVCDDAYCSLGVWGGGGGGGAVGSQKTWPSRGWRLPPPQSGKLVSDERRVSATIDPPSIWPGVCWRAGQLTLAQAWEGPDSGSSPHYTAAGCGGLRQARVHIYLSKTDSRHFSMCHVKIFGACLYQIWDSIWTSWIHRSMESPEISKKVTVIFCLHPVTDFEGRMYWAWCMFNFNSYSTRFLMLSASTVWPSGQDSWNTPVAWTRRLQNIGNYK